MTENTQSPRRLFSLVALIFFAPIVNLLLKDSENDYELSENDLKIINTYKKAGYFVWALAILIIIVFVLYIRYSLDLIMYVIYTLSTILIVYILYNVKLIFDDKGALLFSDKDIKKLEVQQVSAGNVDYLFLYIPFLNEYLYQKKQYTKEQEYWLKESVFLYFLLAIVGIFSIFYSFFINIFFIIVAFIILRIVSLFLGVDFIPDIIKSKIYNSYKSSSIELFAYFCALLHFIFQNIFRLIGGKKALEFDFYLHKAKELISNKTDINSILKKPKKYLYIILSYLIFAIIFLYLLYEGYHSFRPYINLLSVLILGFFIILPSYVAKGLYNLPILTPLLAKILKKF